MENGMHGKKQRSLQIRMCGSCMRLCFLFHLLLPSMLCVMDQEVEAGRIRKKKIDVHSDVFVCIRLQKREREKKKKCG